VESQGDFQGLSGTTRRSARSGASYGASTPVKSLRTPRGELGGRGPSGRGLRRRPGECRRRLPERDGRSFVDSASEAPVGPQRADDGDQRHRSVRPRTASRPRTGDVLRRGHGRRPRRFRLTARSRRRIQRREAVRGRRNGGVGRRHQPAAAHRSLARGIHERAAVPFWEVFVDTPLDVCEARDPKASTPRLAPGPQGLHRRRRAVRGSGTRDLRVVPDMSPEEVALRLHDLLG